MEFHCLIDRFLSLCFDVLPLQHYSESHLLKSTQLPFGTKERDELSMRERLPVTFVYKLLCNSSLIMSLPGELLSEWFLIFLYDGL
jgi:hypothetical protein